eukprot:bmy_14930T0
MWNSRSPMSQHRDYRFLKQNKSIFSSLLTTRHTHLPYPHTTGSTSCAINSQFIAGHVLIHLIGGTTLALISINTATAFITFIILTLLTILEFAVAIIPAYVFTLLWWRDVIRESTFQGHHTPTVQKGLRYGIILFIISENCCSSTLPCYQPLGVYHLGPPQPYGRKSQTHTPSPLYDNCPGRIFYTPTSLGVCEAPFTVSDGVYGSTFFRATGFHGLHIIIGSTFLIVCFLHQLKFHFASNHHFGFEAAA